MAAACFFLALQVAFCALAGAEGGSPDEVNLYSMAAAQLAMDAEECVVDAAGTVGPCDSSLSLRQLRGELRGKLRADAIPEASEDADEDCEALSEYCGDVMTYLHRADCSADICRVLDMGDHFRDVPKGESWLCAPVDTKCDRNFSVQEFQSVDEVPEEDEDLDLSLISDSAASSCNPSRCGLYIRGAACQCNVHCSKFGNCCGNYNEVCRPGGHGNSGSCEGRSCFMYVQGAMCQCNDLCTKYGNCCHDYKQVCDPSDKPSGDKWSSPGIGAGGLTMTLYHTTSLKVAKLIVKGGFRPGKSGWCGGAIYFINTPHLPRSKFGPLTTNGAVLEAKVEMGRMATDFNSKCQGYGGVGVTAANRAGYHSVKFNPGDGDEYIIWNPKQVLSVRIYQQTR